MLRSATILGLMSLCVGVLAGCGGGEKGPTLYKIDGTVTWEGKPVPEGDVAIIPVETGGTSGGGKIVDGKFSVQVSSGRKKIEITAMRDVPGKFSEVNPGEKVQIREQYLPAKYNSASELELNVKAEGKNDPVSLELVP